MKPPSRPQPSPALQGEEVSEAMAPKGNPNQILLPNFHGCVVRHGEIHSDQEFIYFRMSPMPQAQRWREEQMQGHAQEKIEDRMQGLASLGTPVKEV